MSHVFRGEERSMFPESETFPLLSLSVLSGPDALTKYSRDLHHFLCNLRLTQQFITCYCQEYYMKHIATVEHYAGKALRGTTPMNLSRASLWMIDALFSSEVSW